MTNETQTQVRRDERKLALENTLDDSELNFGEITMLVNKIDDWRQTGPTNFTGYSDKISISADYIGRSIFRGKTARVYVCTNEGRIELGEITGKRGYELYGAILKKISDKEDEKRKSELDRIRKSLEIKTEALQKLRQILAGGQQ